MWLYRDASLSRLVCLLTFGEVVLSKVVNASLISERKAFLAMGPAANQIRHTYYILGAAKMANLSIKTLSQGSKKSNGKLCELSPRALPNNKA